MDSGIVVRKAEEKADAFSEVRFVKILGTLLGIASSLNQSSSLIEETPLLICFRKNSREATGHLFSPKFIVGLF